MSALSLSSNTAREGSPEKWEADAMQRDPLRRHGAEATLVPNGDVQLYGEKDQEVGGKLGKQSHDEVEEKDVIWVEFAPNDPGNPFNFSRRRKWITTILAVLFTGEVAATAGAYVPGISSMERDLNIHNHELSLLGIAIYALGFGLPPLVLAPLSEVYGRNVIYLFCHACYTILFVGIGFSKNIASIVILRFLQGAFGSTGSTMVGGTIAGGSLSPFPSFTSRSQYSCIQSWSPSPSLSLPLIHSFTFSHALFV